MTLPDSFFFNATCAECGAPALAEEPSFLPAYTADFDGNPVEGLQKIERVRCVTGKHWYDRSTPVPIEVRVDGRAA